MSSLPPGDLQESPYRADVIESVSVVSGWVGLDQRGPQNLLWSRKGSQMAPSHKAATSPHVALTHVAPTSPHVAANT